MIVAEDPHERGLARAVRAEQSEDRAGLDLEADAVEQPDATSGHSFTSSLISTAYRVTSTPPGLTSRASEGPGSHLRR